MRAVFRTLLVGVLGLMVASCARSEFDQTEGGGSGPVGRVAFSAAVNPQYQLNYTSAESSDVDLDQIQWPTASDFTLDILSAGSVVQTYPYASMPSQLELYVGAYSLHAHSGANAEAWNAPYFEGVQDFSLSSSSTSFDAKLACGLQSTLVYLVFDENFSTIFSDYTAYLNTDHTKEAWVWRAGETRVACMRPTEQLLIRVDVTMRSNGSKYDYGINPLVGLKAGELNVVRFSMVGGEVKATISQDNAVAVQEKTVTLMADWLAHRKTSISATFDPATALEHIYGLPYTTPTDVVVRSNVGLKSLTLKPSGDLALLLGAAEVDLRGANNVQAKTGLVLTKAEGAMAYDGRLNFKGCLNTLPVLSGDASAYTFAVEAVDLLGETSTFEAKINISLPEWQIDAPEWWNRYAYISTLRVTDEAIRDQLAFDYVIRKGTGDWEPLGDGRYTGAHRLYFNGLEPGTLYTAAANLGNGRYETVATFTTDPEPQIPNGDFAQTIERQQGSGIGTYYEPAVWVTPNPITTQNYNGGKTGAQAYPCAKIEGGAVVISTVGYGDNNKIEQQETILSGSEWRNNWVNPNNWWEAGKEGSVQSVVAGKIFLGTTESPSIAFSGKPKSIRLKYKYHCRAGVWEMKLVLKSNEVVLGECIQGGNAPKGEFGDAVEFPVVYQSAHFNLIPTTFELHFVSQANIPVVGDVARVEKTKKGEIWKWAISPDSYFEGSKLTIDDVELVYLQDISEHYTVK